MKITHDLSRDHRENDFPGYDHHDWDVKRELASQVIAVYTGLFIELSLNVRAASCEPCTTSWHTDTELQSFREHSRLTGKSRG